MVIKADGNFPAFNNIPPYDFSDVNSTGAYVALRAIGTRTKVVGKISMCGGKTFIDGVDGCADTNGAHILLASDQAIPDIVMVHEFGHNQGNVDVGCSSCPAGAPVRLMYFQAAAGVTRNEVVPSECKNYQR